MRALRHGMAGQPGWELFGPWDDEAHVREAIVEAGEEFGLRQVGGRAYSVEHARVGLDPVPAARGLHRRRASRHTASGCRRRATKARRRSAAASSPTRIEDYYFTPWDLGYGSYVKFDHDFIGREALERMADGEHRHKVTLALDDEDVTRTVGTMLQKTDRAKFIDWPSAVYSMHPFDRVTVDGETVGVSTWIGYSANEGRMLTLAVLDEEHAEPGHRGHVRLGRGGRRHPQADGRAARAGRDPRGRQPGPVRRDRAQHVPAGQLADGARVTPGTVDDELRDTLAIRELVERWVVWRDAGDWDRFRTLWFDDGRMMATWTQGTADEFIAMSREGWERGVEIHHVLGGQAVDVAGDRAVSQVKMEIHQRATVDGVEVDVTCTGRFYDFLERRAGRWGLVLRQPIYERDRMDPVDPSARLELDRDLLGRFPAGYRHLAYLQTRIGYDVKADMPGLRGPEVDALYASGAAWLRGEPLG